MPAGMREHATSRRMRKENGRVDVVARTACRSHSFLFSHHPPSHALSVIRAMNRTQAYAAAGPSHMSRLAPVDEEDESESGFDGYSSAGSGEDLADEQEEQGHETEGDDEDDDDHEYAQDVSDRKGKGVDHSGVRSELPHRHSSQPVKQTESRTWSELDLSMIIALVSPIGNWLTGSDHVKNLFLLLLLIFYLHQLVEGES